MRAYYRDMVELEVDDHYVLFDRQILHAAVRDAMDHKLGVAHSRFNDGDWYSLSIEMVSEGEGGATYRVIFSDGGSVWREVCSEEDMIHTREVTEARPQ